MKFIIETSPPLYGETQIASAKNAVLPIQAAALLTEETVEILQLPQISDVQDMLALLGMFGTQVQAKDGRCLVTAKNLVTPGSTYEIVKKMRASVLVLGPLLARLGQVHLALPGGCPIGSRPIDLHIKGLRAMGADIRYEDGGLLATAGRLKGANIYLDFPSVGATENIMMAATLASGKTFIQNAAKEPEIVDLAKALGKMGAKINGAGSSFITVDGVERLYGASIQPMADRIEAGSLMLFAAATKGDVFLKKANPKHLSALTAKLLECGANVREDKGGMRVTGGEHMAVDVKTLAYPGFPTDLQAPMMALLCRAQGTSILMESIFENRFMHAAELRRMGAQITIRDRLAIVHGTKTLYGTKVEATDLRAGAALVLAGLVAEGQTELAGIEHIDRGYDHLEQKLRALGARIRREE